MKVYTVQYLDFMYPEDNEIIGVFSSEEKANLVIQNEIDIISEKNPKLRGARRSNYSINEFEVDNYQGDMLC